MLDIAYGDRRWHKIAVNYIIRRDFKPIDLEKLATTFFKDDRWETQESMLNAYPSLCAMYKTGSDGNTIVYYLKDVVATISSFSHAPIEIKF